ncbi:hypothetical protein SAMN05877753_106250 [Bacillus oleivorans]|uniref:YviE n=1 Tax=Bacillus oleivorans TaxID=1448271 RepID=A0A285CZD9_9BACI|nr:DUF6470 family protein [Bacillus oleivorans]SNX72920.1 hypothetical protein SAMN05877753_106250 [Bacillus oleivorans]
MQLPQIRIESQPVIVNIHTNDAIQEIEQPQADVQIRQPQAELNIETRKGKLTIDQTQAWEDMKLYSPLRSIEIFAQEGKQAWLEGIARRAQEGNQLMKIENGGNAIANIAYQKVKPETLNYNIGWIPSHFSVKINYEPGDVEIQAQPREPVINITPQKPIISYKPGSVTYQLEQYPDVKIDFVNLTNAGIGFETTI